MYVYFSTDFESWLERSYNDYITAREKGFKITIGSSRKERDPHAIRPSSLGNCYLQAAYEKEGTSYTNEGSPWAYHIMHGGKIIAEHFQEAMLWSAANHRDAPVVNVEVPVEYEVPNSRDRFPEHGLRLSGLADAIIQERDTGFQAVVEFKYSEGVIKKSRPQPRLGNVLQLMAYMAAIKTEVSYLVMISKWRWDVYTLKANPYFDEYTLYLNGEVYSDVSWPSLSLQTLENEMAEAQFWMMRVKDEGTVKPPLSPTEAPGSFLCARTIIKGTKPKKDGEITRTPTIVANCRFAMKCHGLADGYQYRLEYDPETKKYSLPEMGELHGGEEENDET